MRKVFFSFHYDRDIWRVSQVRNSWLIRAGNTTQPFLDKATWEKIKNQDNNAVRRWIRAQMIGTSVTIILIGAETSKRSWVNFEIAESHNRGNGMLGIYIHGMKDRFGFSDIKGVNPLSNLWTNNTDWSHTYLSSIYPTYDWILDDGRQNINRWIESAAMRAGK